MNNTANHHKGRRKRKAVQPTYYRVTATRSLGETPAVRAVLQNEGLLELVTAELREVYYYRVDARQRRRDFCAVGWPNENGGWEIRHPRYTGCIGPKGMTFVGGEPGKLFIFSELTDYLCWKYNHSNEFPNILILNHPEFLAAAKRRALKFSSVTVSFGQQHITLIRPADYEYQSNRPASAIAPAGSC